MKRLYRTVLDFLSSARDVLHGKLNDASNANIFDQILNSRHFNSVIYKEENVYGDRSLTLKDNAQNQLLEAERVKKKNT
jgi:hypothetical protein